MTLVEYYAVLVSNDMVGNGTKPRWPELTLHSQSVENKVTSKVFHIFYGYKARQKHILAKTLIPLDKALYKSSYIELAQSAGAVE